MQQIFEPVRLTRFAVLAVASATALSAGACSSSKNSESPATSPATSAPASAHGAETALGLIASVSGNSVQVTEKTGTATVDVSPSTKVMEYVNAQLTDIAAGNCVRMSVKPAPPPGGPGTATAVQLNPPGGDGKCPQPKNTSPNAVVGTVASVAGNSVTVTATDANGNPSPTEVTVTDQTRYTKGAAATSQAIAQGKCINASGTKDSGGTLQAKAVNLVPATNGGCPQFGVKGQSH